jgi:hypothetical protein
VAPYRLEDRERPDDVGAQERLGVGQRVVDVSFGGEMHNHIRLPDKPADQSGVGDIALHQPDLIRDRRQ